jgi:hypothetical protein
VKRSLLFFIFYLCATSCAWAQFFRPARIQELDSLAALVKIPSEDTIYIDRLNRFAYIQQFAGLKEAATTAEKAKELGTRLKYKKAIWQADVVLGQKKFVEKDFPTSIALHEEALDNINSDREYSDVLKLRSGFLNVLFFTGDYPRAMTESLKGLDLALKKKDKNSIASYTNLLGFIHFHQGNLSLARKN